MHLLTKTDSILYAYKNTVDLKEHMYLKRGSICTDNKNVFYSVIKII